MFNTGTEPSPHPPLQVVTPPLHVASPPLPRENQENKEESIELEPLKLEMAERQREELTNLVQRVFVLPGHAAPRTVVLLATEPGNGCSWICSRAAQILASQVRGPICVVDANLRAPALHHYFGVETHHGLSEAIEATEPIRDFVRPLGGENLWFLSSGANSKNALITLGSDPIRLRLAELQQYFEYVLIDGPALSLGNDGIMLGRAAEGIVLVLKANASRREPARNAVQELQSAGARVLGVVLNQRTFPIPQAIYSKL
jgi:Mrp family chromosome partitioning ATPase